MPEVHRRLAPMQELYPREGESFPELHDYGPLIGSLGTLVVRIDDADSRGYSRCLFRDQDRWGVLLLGWGSCSGCDALRHCESYEELEALRRTLKIRWGTKDEILALLSEKDWEVEAGYHEKEHMEFVSQAKAAMGAA